MEKRKTIKKEVIFEGKGLDTGKPCKIALYPSKEKGIKFKIDGRIYNLRDIEFTSEKRGTCLIFDKKRIYYVEHLMSALYGAGIDDVIVEIEGDEIPFFDGSSKVFVQEIEKAGVTENEEELKYYEIKRPFKMNFENSSISILPHDKFEIIYRFTREPFIEHEYTFVFNEKNYSKEIALSKTFITYEEAVALKEKGYYKGGDEKLALIYKDGKPLNKEIQTFENEPARHKILDVIGDLSLTGKRFKGRFIFEGTGHRDHLKFLPFLEAYSGCGEEIGIETIRKVMPHDYPFLFVDKIISLEEDRVVGVKNVTYNENFFEGHFPEMRVMPGVLIIEAMAQTGGFLLLNKIKDKNNKIVFFTSIDNAKFRNPVYPGDTLYFVLNLLRFKGKICRMKGYAVKDDKIVCEAILTAAITEREG